MRVRRFVGIGGLALRFPQGWLPAACRTRVGG